MSDTNTQSQSQSHTWQETLDILVANKYLTPEQASIGETKISHLTAEELEAIGLLRGVDFTTYSNSPALRLITAREREFPEELVDIEEEWFAKFQREEAEKNKRFSGVMDQVRTCINVAVDEGHSRIDFEGSVHEDLYLDGRKLIIRMMDGTFLKLTAEVGEVHDLDYRTRLDELAAFKGHDMGDWDWMYQNRRWVSMCSKCGATNTQAERAKEGEAQIEPVWTRMAANLGCGEW